MQTITIDTGMQEYLINNRAVLRFNPSDPNLYHRFFAAAPKLDALDAELTEQLKALPAEPDDARAERGLALLTDYDHRIKALLTEIFGGENDFDKVLEGVNLAGTGANGKRVVQNLLDALTPILQDGAAQHLQATAANARGSRRRPRGAGAGMTPNLWTLPETVHFADTDWRVHTDFRDVLEILRWLDGSADPALTDSERWYVALALFYRDFSLMPPTQYREACEAMATFVQAGRPDGGPCAPRLMDWQQDAALIAAGTARAAGQDLRALPHLHWWSFLGWFDSISDGPFATVVALRDKLRRGKKLEPWEREFYRAHRAEVDLHRPASPEADAEKQRLLALLNEDERRGK